MPLQEDLLWYFVPVSGIQTSVPPDAAAGAAVSGCVSGAVAFCVSCCVSGCVAACVSSYVGCVVSCVSSCVGCVGSCVSSCTGSVGACSGIDSSVGVELGTATVLASVASVSVGSVVDTCTSDNSNGADVRVSLQAVKDVVNRQIARKSASSFFICDSPFILLRYRL